MNLGVISGLKYWKNPYEYIEHSSSVSYEAG